MNTRNVSFSRAVQCILFASAALIALPLAWAQQPATTPADSELADSVRELREQVQQLRAAVSEIKSEAAQYRAENDELRRELEGIRGLPVPGRSAEGSAPTAQGSPANTSTEQRISSLESTTQLQQSEMRTLYQTKVESASKYRVRLTGLVLLNIFHNNGAVDNQDVPSYATSTAPYGITPAFGATMRQSEFGLEVFGPKLFGAKTSGEVNLDFGGGFPAGQLDGLNTGIVRMRTADMHLDWQSTSLIVGQDGLFVSPNSPASFASLLVPSFGYSGNLWGWIPQVRVEHRFDFSENASMSIAGGILDNITGEYAYAAQRLPQAGESSGQPAYAARTGFTRNFNGRPLTIGASGYYSRQNWGFGWTADGWAAISDWRIPLPARLELSGEFFRGRAIGGLGGGIGQSVLYSGSPTNPYSGFLPLNSAGGWSQLKFAATSRLEFNGVFGLDNPFASDIHAFPSPVSIYSNVLAANRSEMMNFIYRPRSDLLLSGEYRHLHTTEIGNYSSADQVNLVMGVLF